MVTPRMPGAAWTWGLLSTKMCVGVCELCLVIKPHERRACVTVG